MIENIKELLDVRICDYEKEANNTQTFREFIRESEEEFCMKHVDLDNFTNDALNEYLDFLSELWGK